MLELKNISKSFDKKTVLDNISLTLEKGSIISLLGPSGSGKTTLLNIILGIITLDSGSLIYDSKEISKLPMKLRGCNIVFQDYALFPNLSAYKNIVYGLRNNPNLMSSGEVNALISLLELNEHKSKQISQLSGGQKQRVALARTLVTRPKILLLDEPLSALDSLIKETIKEQIHMVTKKFNLITILVTHDPEEALTISDKVLILNNGKVAQYGEANDIINHPADSFVKEFIYNQLDIKRKNIHRLFGEDYV